MTRMSWDATGERYYETGVDRGALFVGAQVGVPWPGLISVAESPTGGESRSFYQDGIKYMALVSGEEFAATVEAYSSPPEFGPCDGTTAIQNGLYATQQPRKPFGFSYRTMVGNDLDGRTHAYKLHLVYNALASPSIINNVTVADQVDLARKSWAIATVPPSLTGLKPTAHFVIDSRHTPETLLSDVEDILYGTEVLDARLPSANELITMFQSY